MAERSTSENGLTIGTLLGVRVYVDFSLFVIVALVTINLGAAVFPAWHPEWGLLVRWTVALAAALLFFASILAHELAHAVVGRRLGVPMGGITLFMFGGMAHMEREPERPRVEFLMAAVGPLTSVVIGVVSAFLGSVLGSGPLSTLLSWLGPVNVFLGLFNLVPGFPLDGGRMLRALVWWTSGSYRKATRVATLSGQGVAMLLIACGLAMSFGLRVPALGSGLGPGLWLALVGWFLYGAARTSQRQALVLEALEGVSVERLMRRTFDAVALTPCTLRGSDTGAEALRLLGQHSVEQLPVVDDEGKVMGLIRRDDLLRWVVLHSDRGSQGVPPAAFGSRPRPSV
jgi:Zn-dependent protease